MIMVYDLMITVHISVNVGDMIYDCVDLKGWKIFDFKYDGIMLDGKNYEWFITRVILRENIFE